MPRSRETTPRFVVTRMFRTGEILKETHPTREKAMTIGRQQSKARDENLLSVQVDRVERLANFDPKKWEPAATQAAAGG